MYVENRKRSCQREIDKPIWLKMLIRADLLLVMILCAAHALNYVNATGETWVCMSETPKHVCMFETLHYHPGGGSDSSRKAFSI